ESRQERQGRSLLIRHPPQNRAGYNKRVSYVSLPVRQFVCVDHRRMDRQQQKEHRRFPPPWSVEELDACFVARDHKGHQLARLYYRLCSLRLPTVKKYLISCKDDLQQNQSNDH